MLDERCFALLNIINNFCEGTNYKVVDFESLLTMFPEYINMDISGIKECIKTLSYGNYISVMYEDDREICLKPQSKGRAVTEEKNQQTIHQIQENKSYFKYSFIGAFLGGMIISLIFTLVIILLRWV